MMRPLTVAMLLSVVPALAQQPQRLGADCRPMPLPGYIMAPQPPSEACLQRQAVEARERQTQADAEERQRSIQAAANAKANQERMQIEQARCSTAEPESIKSTVEQSPTVFGGYFRVLDVAEPHYIGGSCRSEIMTTKGIVDGIITFQNFNGKRYIRVRVVAHDGGDDE